MNDMAHIEAGTFRQMVDAMPVAVMMADIADFKIIYMNKVSLETLRSIEHLLPVKADRMVGQVIDIFHKDPSHQRRLLASVKNEGRGPRWLLYPRDG